MDKGNVLKNGIYNSIGNAVRMALGIIVIPFLIRSIGLDEYGLWTLIFSVVGLVELAEIGLSVSTTYFVSRDLSDSVETGIAQTLTVTLGVVLVMATLAAAVLWWGANVVVTMLSALRVSQQIAAARALRIGVVVVWSDLLRRVFVGIEQAYQRYDLINLLVTGQAIISSLGLLLIAMLGGDTIALVRWQALLSMSALIVHLFVSRWLLRGVSLRPTWDWSRVKEIVRYSVFTWLTSLSSALFSKADRLVIGASLGTEALAVYGAITSIMSKINHLSSVPVQPLLPAMGALAMQRQQNQGVLQGHIQQAVRINAAIALGLSAMLFVFAPSVMAILLSDAVTEGAILGFRLAAIIYGLYSLNAVGYYVLLGINAVPVLMGVQMASAVLALLCIGFGAHAFGLTGAIVGNGAYLGTLWLIFWGMKRLEVRPTSWLGWFVFPLSWFVVTIGVVIFFTPALIPWGVIWGGFSVAILLGWFIRAERELFETFLHSRGFWRRQHRSEQV